jgi:hypothetical protein
MFERKWSKVADCVAKVWPSTALVYGPGLIGSVRSLAALATSCVSRGLRRLDQPGHLAKVVSDSGKRELVLRTGWPAQS